MIIKKLKSFEKDYKNLNKKHYNFSEFLKVLNIIFNNQILPNKYKDKIFIIPKCFKEFCDNKEDIESTINIFYFFLERFIKENNLFYIIDDFEFLKQSLY